MQKKVTLIFSILAFCVTFLGGTAQAITGISSDLVPDEYIDGVPCLVLNKGEYFSFRIVPQNPIGTISWYGEYTNHDSPQEVHQMENNGLIDDGTVYTEGTLSTDTYYTVILRAYDSGATGENASREYKYIARNVNYTGSIEIPHFVLSQDTTVSTGLHQAIISPIILSDEVIARLAQNISVDPSEIILLTSADFDPSEPPEPTNAMRQKVQGQFMAKLNTIKVSKDGWYVFMITVSDDLVGTKVGDLRLYGAEVSDFTASSFNAAFGLMPIVNGITGGLEISNFFGVKLDTLPKQFLATMFLSASQSLTVYIVKILLLLLGGCDAGLGVIGGWLMIIVGSIFAVRFIKRKRR